MHRAIEELIAHNPNPKKLLQSIWEAIVSKVKTRMTEDLEGCFEAFRYEFMEIPEKFVTLSNVYAFLCCVEATEHINEIMWGRILSNVFDEDLPDMEEQIAIAERANGVDLFQPAKKATVIRRKRSPSTKNKPSL